MAEAPSGVKLRFADGRTVACTVERAPQYDRRRRKGLVEYYTARPVEPVSPELTYQVVIDRHPPMTGVHVDVGGDGDASSLMRGMQPKD